MPTKNTFQAIAKILASVKADHVDFSRSDASDIAEDNGRELAKHEIAGKLADHFAAENPRFDRERFLTAAGVK